MLFPQARFGGLAFCSIDKKLEYSYNSNGNITSITSSKADGTSATTKTLAYDTTYPDRLTSFDGRAIGYNAYGYLTSYRGWTYSWSKGRLSSISRGTLQTGRYRYSFSYNGLGQRIQKMYSYIQGTGAIQPVGYQLNYSRTDYTYDNAGRLIKERRVDQFSDSAGDSLEEIREFRYLYDTNSIIGMVYTSNGTTNTYYFDKNLQGDVIGIYDTSGNLKAGYSYDAFGECTITDSTVYDLARNNPIRYRGYYYDTDTELYYLNARYYNPELRRFISPDDTAYIDPETPNGLNLYAYCNNDPVNYADPSGHEPKWWQSILIGIGVIAIAALATAAIVYTGGGAAAFFTAAGYAALGGLKTAAVVGATAGIVRASKMAIDGGDIGSIGKSLILGFSDGFLVGSIYAAGSMILGAASFRVAGLFNNGYGWSSGSYIGGYQTPKTPGVTIFAHQGGVNGGRSFGLDLDIYNGLHLHTNKFGVGKKSSWIKYHHWYAVPIGIGIFIGLSDGWSEW